MTEQATVLRVTKDRIELACTSDACASCTSIFCSPKVRTFEAANPLGLDIKPRDAVEIEIPTAPAIAAAFRIFVMPLVLFAAGFFAMRAAGVVEEAVQVAVGLVGLVLGFFLVWLRGRLRPDSDRPIILRKMEPAEVVLAPVVLALRDRAGVDGAKAPGTEAPSYSDGAPSSETPDTR